MFERLTSPVSHDNQPTAAIYQSTLLREAGVLHSFSTRQAVAQTNSQLKSHSNTQTNAHAAAESASPALIQENEWDLATALDIDTGQPTPAYQLLLQATGCAQMPMVHVNQVHGNSVLLVDITDATLNKPSAEAGKTPRPQGSQQGELDASVTTPTTIPAPADGLVTSTPGMALAIRVADCVPVLFAAVVQGRPVVVAAVHAGWRGLVAGIIPEAVRTIHQQLEELAGADINQQRSVKSEDVRIIAAIGPCISAKHYEVDEQVAEAFADANLDAAIINQQGQKPHINLPLAAKLQLLASGVNEADIDPGTLCTYDNQSDFYSHRRDHGQTGRLAAMIALKPA